MKPVLNFTVRALRKIIGNKSHYHPLKYYDYVDLNDQQANDYIYRFLTDGSSAGKMLSKFGSIELGNIVAAHYELYHWDREFFNDVMDYNASFDLRRMMKMLCSNAGFFPYNLNLGIKYYNRMLLDMPEIDVLSSYIYEEKFVMPFLTEIKKRVNLDGFYAPFMWKNPWTKALKGKRVLVVHPFVESIRSQYENNREKIWTDPNVLPEFSELLTLKAVQSIADAKEQPYKNWFEALEYMEDEISKMDFDVAIIGCGAYGMCLAAHVKRMGKTAIHLAGWTQMLFGVYGNRWIKDQPEYAKFINEYWVRPNENERPKGAEKVEGGCYW